MTQAADTARCSSCHRPVWWGRTRAGKLMPLDPEPVEDGNVVLEHLVDDDERALRALAGVTLAGEGPTPTPGPPAVRVLRQDELLAPDVPRYVSHFATCPQAAHHRRAR